jgi:HEAT repeat protein
MTETQDRTAVGVFTTDTKLVIGSWDIWMARASGVSQEQARGKHLLDLFPDIETRGLTPRLRAIVERGTVDVLAPAFHHYLIRCPTSEGDGLFDTMQQHVTLSPLREHGEIAGLIVTIEDVTARCVRERRLAQQLKSDEEAIRMRAAQQLPNAGAGAPWSEALGDSSWKVRRAAVTSLGEAGGQDAIAQLVELIRDKHTDLATLNASLSALTLAKRDSLPVIASLLESADANVRMYTALALGNMQDARGLPHLLPLLDDEDVNVRYHVIEALGRIGSAVSVEPLLNVVRERDPFVSFAALDALADSGEPVAMPEVISLLDDPALSPAAIDTLAAVGNEHAVGPLASALGHSAAPTAVCHALAAIHARLQREFGEGELVADLARTRIDADAVARLLASIPRATDAELPSVARVLGWLRFEGIESVLCGLLRHAPSRRNAQEGLVALGPRAMPPLRAELKDPSSEVRQAAAAVLGRIGGADCVPDLVALLRKETMPEVLVTIIAALGSIGSPAAFDALVPLLGHTDAAVRHSAVAAVNSIAHPDTARRVRGLLTNESSLVREAAVKVAGYFGFAECFDVILSLLTDESPHVRRAVAEHLPYFEDSRSQQALSRGMRDADPGVRSASARALSQMSGPGADALLDTALTDHDPRVRYQAAQAAGIHRTRRLSPVLRELLANDSAIPVRIAAAVALGQHQDVEAVDVLKVAANHPEADLACPAITALSRIPRADVHDIIESALFGSDARRQLAAVDAIANRPEYLEQLAKVAATAHDERVIGAALNALANSGDSEAVNAVIELCARDDRRDECVSALSKVGSSDIAHVARGLQHPDVRVRGAVVRALARMRVTEASRELSAALNDSDSTVRFAAAQALGRFDLLPHDASFGKTAPSPGS